MTLQAMTLTSMAPCCLPLPPGTLVSGALYTFTGGSVVRGFGNCFVASIAFVAMSALITTFIGDDSGGLSCGACLQLVAPPPHCASPTGGGNEERSSSETATAQGGAMTGHSINGTNAAEAHLSLDGMSNDVEASCGAAAAADAMQQPEGLAAAR